MLRTYKTKGYKYRYRCDISGLIMLFLAAVAVAGAFYGLSMWQPTFHASCVNVEGGDECRITLR